MRMIKRWILTETLEKDTALVTIVQEEREVTTGGTNL